MPPPGLRAGTRNGIAELEAPVFRRVVHELDGEHPRAECDPEERGDDVDDRNQGQDEDGGKARQVVGELPPLAGQGAQGAEAETEALVVARPRSECLALGARRKRAEKRAREERGEKSEHPARGDYPQDVEEGCEHIAQPVQPVGCQDREPLPRILKRVVADREQRGEDDEADRERCPHERAEGLRAREPPAPQETAQPDPEFHGCDRTSAFTARGARWTSRPPRASAPGSPRPRCRRARDPRSRMPPSGTRRPSTR